MHRPCVARCLAYLAFLCDRSDGKSEGTQQAAVKTERPVSAALLAFLNEVRGGDRSAWGFLAVHLCVFFLFSACFSVVGNAPHVTLECFPCRSVGVFLVTLFFFLS